MIKQVTENGNEWINYDGVTVLDFWAPWCGPCKQLSPTLDELDKLDIAQVVKCNVDDFPEIASSFGVMGVPALFFFKDGEQVRNELGTKSLDQLKTIIEEIKS